MVWDIKIKEKEKIWVPLNTPVSSSAFDVNQSWSKTHSAGLFNYSLMPAKIREPEHLQPKAAAHTKEENKLHLDLKGKSR